MLRVAEVLYFGVIIWVPFFTVIANNFRKGSVKGTYRRYRWATITRFLLYPAFLCVMIAMAKNAVTGPWWVVLIWTLNLPVMEMIRRELNRDDDDNWFKKMKKKAKTAWANRPRLVIRVPQVAPISS